MSLLGFKGSGASRLAKTRGASLGLGRFALRRMLAVINVGSVIIDLPGGDRLEHVGAHPGPQAHIRFDHWRPVRRLISQGDIGLARGYFEGEWTTPDLTAVIELGARNGQRFMDALSGNWLFRFINGLAHRINENTREGSRRNILAHYDLGNDFYRLWLDRSMMYSSAIFRRRDASLEEAQQTKLARIVEKLELHPAATVLEIGGGWGAMAATLARAGVKRITSLTLSPAQLTAAKALVEKEDFDAHVEFRLQDYRDVQGRFDRIVSIEMIEAVGKKFLPKYFETIRDRLKPEGVCVLQAITIADDRFDYYCSRPDFIQRYVFPGGFLPSQALMRETWEKAGLKLVAMETFGESYALTLKEWRRRFLAAWPQIEGLGFDAPFRRLWEYYLCYCEAGFRTGIINVGLYCLRRQP